MSRYMTDGQSMQVDKVTGRYELIKQFCHSQENPIASLIANTYVKDIDTLTSIIERLEDVSLSRDAIRQECSHYRKLISGLVGCTCTEFDMETNDSGGFMSIRCATCGAEAIVKNDGVQP